MEIELSIITSKMKNKCLNHFHLEVGKKEKIKFDLRMRVLGTGDERVFTVQCLMDCL